MADVCTFWNITCYMVSHLFQKQRVLDKPLVFTRKDGHQVKSSTGRTSLPLREELLELRVASPDSLQLLDGGALALGELARHHHQLVTVLTEEHVAENITNITDRKACLHFGLHGRVVPLVHSQHLVKTGEESVD